MYLYKTKATNFLIQLIILTCLIYGVSGCNSNVSTERRDMSVAAKVDSLLGVMTLREKIGQMNQYSAGTYLTGPQGPATDRYERYINGEVGSVLNLVGVEETRKLQELVVEKSRLGIPLIFAYDVIHGYKSIFPIPLAESCSWDLELIEQSARIAAIESAASGLQWTFAPMVDVSRDARWGRVMGGAGEDPYLGSLIAQARIRGFQGDDLSDSLTIMACAKHFAAYGFAESGKDYNAVNLGRNMLHNVVMPPFKASVEAGAATFMNSFNDIDGVPSTMSSYLMRDILYQKWGFDGAVVSDWNSIGEMLDHGVAADLKQTAMLAANAGCHIDMEGDAYIQYLAELVKDGKVKQDYIDDAVRRILTLKYELGLFDDPYRYMDPLREASLVGSEEHMDATYEMAINSIVLLKNENNLLPLENFSSIAVIGPLAADKDAPIGNWRAQGEQNSAISLLEGLQCKLKGVTIRYEKGCDLSIGPNNFFDELVIEENDRSGFADAIALAKSSELVILALGEPAMMSGEARSRADIGLPGLQKELLREIYKVNKSIVLVLMNGRPLEVAWEAEHVPAIVEAWHLGSRAGTAIASVLTGEVNPSGKLTMSFPRATGQLPLYYNHLNTGRPYDGDNFYSHHMDVENTALYPFGFGLSYTSFEYSKQEIMVGNTEVTVSVDITNTGIRPGKEIVQLYIRDYVASVARPVKELKDFKKVQVPSGETKTVKFTLNKEDLSFYNSDGDLVFEPGEFGIAAGPNSRDITFSSVQFE